MTAARSSHGVRDQSCHAVAAASIACWTCSASALRHRCEDVILVVRHDLVERVRERDVLAADDERQLEPLAGELVQPLAQLVALGRCRARSS